MAYDGVILDSGTITLAMDTLSNLKMSLSEIYTVSESLEYLKKDMTRYSTYGNFGETLVNEYELFLKNLKNYETKLNSLIGAFETNLTERKNALK